jgi:hypothetical protein
MPHGRELRELCGEFREIDGASAFVNLDGIASAQADRGSALAVQVDEVAADAAGTLRIASGGLRLANLAGPDIDSRHASGGRAGHEDLERVSACE